MLPLRARDPSRLFFSHAATRLLADSTLRQHRYVVIILDLALKCTSNRTRQQMCGLSCGCGGVQDCEVARLLPFEVVQYCKVRNTFNICYYYRKKILLSASHYCMLIRVGRTFATNGLYCRSRMGVSKGTVVITKSTSPTPGM